MGKLSKADLKVQKEVQAMLRREEPWTMDEREWIYANYDPSMDSEIGQYGIFFTPLAMAADHVMMSCRDGHVVDCCSGIGGLTWSMLTRNYHQERIQSITLIEFNPHFLEMSRRLLSPMSAYTESRTPITLNFINGSVWDQQLWTSITSGLTDNRFDSFQSNPPYGKASAEEKAEMKWLHYVRGGGGSEREIAAHELAWRYSRSAAMILPPMSVDFRYSGRAWGYERRPCRKMDKLRKVMPEGFFVHQESTSVDTSVYEQFKGTNISVESVSISFDAADYA